MLNGKTIILGVSGGIAAYKMANLASMLVKLHANVHVIMTEHATNFIHPLTFETLTNNKCITDTFDRNVLHHVEHVALAKQADVLLIAPATANIIGKLAGGLADDMLTTTCLACTCPKMIAPAMNTNMYENAIVQENIEKLRQHNMEVITPDTGYLACGDTGIGKMPSPEVLLQYILKELVYPKDMEGIHVLITAGPTQESIDPVRYITNHSTGKMGYALAKTCAYRGAKVTLITGPTHIEPPMFVDVIAINSAKEMYEAVLSKSKKQDIIIKAAAVADYRPKEISMEKMKKSDQELSIDLERTDDILKYLGDHKEEHQFLCGFSMETQNMIENSRRKLQKKNLDMIVANNLKEAGAGFGTETNRVTIITEQEHKTLELMPKEEVAKKLIDEILRIR
ncbi:MAG: bifunctional phosphopantothenoylcysteine decarboxylase/phosphopantothenate--cysteine ligase CoaBC [Lachnospiraceae bacterium]